MSRTVIAAVVAVVIAALTAIAFFVTSTSYEDKVRKDAEAQLRRSYQVVQQLAQLEAIDVANKAERLAGDKAFVTALKSESAIERANQARVGFTKFTSNEKEGDRKPDMIALFDANGLLIAMSDMASVVPKQFQKEGGKPGETVVPALNVVLGSRVIISDIWNDKDRMMKIGVAPVIDADAPVPANDPDGVVIIGAVLVAYAQSAQEAQQDKRLLGTEIAYHDQQRVVATSFTKDGTNDEDTAKAAQLSQLVKNGTVKEGSDKPTKVTIDGVTYYAAAVQMPRSTTRRLPADYPAVTAGAMVLAGAATSNVASTTKILILLVGIGALAISLLGLYLTHRRLVAQVDQIELGVTDIINGNVDRTFRPVGAELDGLANGLNVMLARLLGRPEPGEEEFDEEGNPIIPGRVDFEEGEEKPAVDPDLANLAKESEPDYYKRVFTEYVAARKASGSPDDVSFENFIAKLKVNEGKLKAQYNCRAVRFRVVTKDGKVSLKPVPIFE
jgi:type II secretory pathway pseudopilin PulG